MTILYRDLYYNEVCYKGIAATADDDDDDGDEDDDDETAVVNA